MDEEIEQRFSELSERLDSMNEKLEFITDTLMSMEEFLNNLMLEHEH